VTPLSSASGTRGSGAITKKRYKEENESEPEFLLRGEDPDEVEGKEIAKVWCGYPSPKLKERQ